MILAQSVTYTAADVVTVLTQVGLLLAGVGAIIVNIIVALRTGNKIDIAAQKTDGLVSQVQQVHTLTNSNLSAVKADLKAATAQIVALVELVHDLRAEREKAAINVAMATPVAVVVPARTQDSRAGDAATVQKLDLIERNTAATVEVLKAEGA